MSKIYEFAFERRSLLTVVCGSALLLLLVYTAGFLSGIGLQLWTSTPVLIVTLPSPPIPTIVPAAPVEAEVLAAEELPAIDAVEESSIEPTEASLNSAPKMLEDPGEVEAAFVVQLGAFRQEENASLLSRRIAAMGYEAAVVSRVDDKGRIWYLVRLGQFTTSSEANKFASELKIQEHIEAVVRPLDSM